MECAKDPEVPPTRKTGLPLVLEKTEFRRLAVNVFMLPLVTDKRLVCQVGDRGCAQISHVLYGMIETLQSQILESQGERWVTHLKVQRQGQCRFERLQSQKSKERLKLTTRVSNA